MVLLSIAKRVEELIPFGMAVGGYVVVIEGDAEIESPSSEAQLLHLDASCEDRTTAYFA